MEYYDTDDIVVNEIRNDRQITNFIFSNITFRINPDEVIEIEKHYDLTINDVMADINMRSSDSIKDELVTLINFEKEYPDRNPAVYYLLRNEKYKDLYTICECCGKPFLKTIEGKWQTCYNCDEKIERDSNSKKMFTEFDNLKKLDVRNILK